MLTFRSRWKKPLSAALVTSTCDVWIPEGGFNKSGRPEAHTAETVHGGDVDRPVPDGLVVRIGFDRTFGRGRLARF